MPEVVEITNERFPALTFDADEFIKYVKDQNLSDSEAQEFLLTVWVYMVTFVDLSFGIKGSSADRQLELVGSDELSLDHESALVQTCSDTFRKNARRKSVPRSKGRRAGRKDSWLG